MWAVTDEHECVARRVNLDDRSRHADLARVLKDKPPLPHFAREERRAHVQTAHLGAKPRHGSNNARLEAPIARANAERPVLGRVIQAPPLQHEVVAAVDLTTKAPLQPLDLQDALVRRHGKQSNLGNGKQ